MRTLLELGVWSAPALLLAGCSIDESCFDNGVCPQADAAYVDVVGDTRAEGDVSAEVQMGVTETGADSVRTSGTDACSAEFCSEASADAFSDASLDEGLRPARDGGGDVVSDSPCSDVLTDPLNCGTCGSACPGASAGESCSSGHCQPYSIGSAVSPFALATDGVNVYYLSNSSAGIQLASIPVGGGAATGAFSAPGASVIATDGVDVYWGGVDPSMGNQGSLSLSPIGDLGNAQHVAASADAIIVESVNTTLNSLFFAIQCQGVRSVPLQTPNASIGSGPGNGCIGAGALASDGYQVYWANPSSAPSHGPVLGVFAQPSSGASNATTLSTASDVRGLAVQGSFVYYTDAAAGTVSRVTVNGAGLMSLALASAPGGMVVDANYVYWIDASGTSIMKVPVGGGNATPVAMSQSATAIAQDAANVYWTNSSAIMRYPK